MRFRFMYGTLAAVLISTSTLIAATRYVDVNSVNPSWPYDDWSVAASTIQDAIDAADPGDLILVTNGVYASGGRVVSGSLMNRLVVDKAVTVQSVNGPAATVIAGNQVPGTMFGDGAVRCVYLTNNAMLIGFTLTNGATRGATALTSERYGGGIYSRSATAVVSNCIIVKNAAATQGGGVYQGTFFNCTLLNNVSTNGGGAYGASLMNCTLAGNQAVSFGGGAYSSMLTNCWLWTNWAGLSGGGVNSGTLTNCTVGGNSSGNGGGTYSATVMNCVLTTNVASGLGGGANGGILTGSILAGNSAWTGGGSYSAAVTASFFTGNISTNAGGGVNGGMVTNSTFSSNVVMAGNGGGAGSATLVNCLLMNNSAFTTAGNESWTAGNGGGAYGGTLLGCALVRNFAMLAGGGASGGTLNNCTLVANTASAIGGGADGATLNNCVVFYNSAALGVNYNGGILHYCCTTPLPMAGNGNISAEPLLADAFHLSGASPCRAAGNASYASGKDIDGELWASPPSMGCDEFNAATAAGTLSVTIQADYTNAAVGAPLNFSASVNGKAAFNWWNFGDGTVVSNRPYTAHAWSTSGDYLVTFRAYNNDYPAGVSATMMVHVVTQPVHYVAIGSPNPTPPYQSWATAARNIQDAIDAATVSGAKVVVSNGIYATGGRVIYGALTNRVAVTMPLALQSVNGPAVTVIGGNPVLGDSAVRCVYLTSGASLTGFTLTNGATRAAGESAHEGSGGAIWCASSSSVISNCIVSGNLANAFGGGILSGKAINCQVTGNVSYIRGGGAYGASMVSCALFGNVATNSGGGIYSGDLVGCTLTANSSAEGGGANSATLSNCVVTGNSASYSGGGVGNGALFNCTLSNNYAVYLGGGSFLAVLNGCRLIGNVVSNNYSQSSTSGGGAYGGALTNCMLNSNLAAGLGAGGGAYFAVLDNCGLTNNFATMNGGGAVGCTVVASALASNSVPLAGYSVNGAYVGPVGGGASGGSLSGCVLIGNSGMDGGGAGSGTLTNCILKWNRSTSKGGGSQGANLNNCALLNNSAPVGGGASGGTLNNCTLVANTASAIGGGADGATLNNCVVFYNSAALGVNYNGGTLNYCCTTPLPMAGNGNISVEPLLADAFHLSGASPCRAAGSAGYASGKDIDGELWASPPSMGCDEFNAATAAGTLSVTIQADYTNAAVGAPLNFSASVNGKAAFNWWNFGDGTVVSNRPYAAHAWSSAGDYLVTFRAFNNDYPAGVSATMMVHVVTQPVHYVAIGNPNPTPPYQSWATAATNIQDAIEVATVSGAKVVVSNGVYATGGRVIYGALTNRVAVTMPLALQSVNGPAVTVIGGNPILGDSAVRCVYLANGASLTGFTLTNGATRAAVVSNQDPEQCGAGIWCGSPLVTVSNSVIVGNVSIVHGAGAYSGILNNCVIMENVGTLDVVSITGDAAYGVVLNDCLLASNRCDGMSYSRASNCTIMGNRGNGANNSTLNDCTINANGRDGADFSTLNDCIVNGNSGAGANSSTLIRCAVSGNSGGGVVLSKLSYCTVADNSAPAGGGAVSSTLDSCIVAGNHSGYQGGGLESCVANSCLLIGNVAGSFGGGAYNAKLSNCTIVSNTASTSPYGGGTCGGASTNCIIYYNSVSGVSATGTNYAQGALMYCGTFPMPTNGVGNITNEPAFMDIASGDFHLRSNSPCVNTGTNYSGLNSLDLDGRPRLIGARVDLGAYEFQGASTADYLRWLQQYGISTDASSDNADFDSDGLNNRQEWLAGTVPTNTVSALRLLTPIRNNSGLIVIWQSVTNRSYFIERRNSLGAAGPFLILTTNIPGQLGTTSFIDTSATNSGPFFYRVGAY